MFFSFLKFLSNLLETGEDLNRVEFRCVSLQSSVRILISLPFHHSLNMKVRHKQEQIFHLLSTCKSYYFSIFEEKHKEKFMK